jgi:hypothetical protein
LLPAAEQTAEQVSEATPAATEQVSQDVLQAAGVDATAGSGGLRPSRRPSPA